MLLQIVSSAGLKYLQPRLFRSSVKKCNKFLMFLSTPQVRECRTCLDSEDVNIFDSVDFQKYLKYITLQNKYQPEGGREINQLIETKISLEEELRKLEEMPSDGDKEFEKLIISEKKEYLDSIEEIKKQILYQIFPRYEDKDNRNVELKIIPGIGGDEAKFFSEELYAMYFNYALFKNWEWSGTMKDDSILISGDQVFGHLKHEAGVHRVQRVPCNDTLHRIHTSTCSVVILPQPEPHEIQISEKDLIVERIKSSGPGGQNVNKRETCIRMKHIPTGITIENQSSRFQFQNYKDAVNRLRVILYNKEYEKEMSERRATQKEQAGTNDYSDKIRTYNFPQSRVTDHRINQSTKNLKGFLSGEKELDNFITRVREQNRKMDFISNIKKVLESVEYKTFEKQQAK